MFYLNDILIKVPGKHASAAQLLYRPVLVSVPGGGGPGVPAHTGQLPRLERLLHSRDGAAVLHRGAGLAGEQQL